MLFKAQRKINKSIISTPEWILYYNNEMKKRRFHYLNNFCRPSIKSKVMISKHWALCHVQRVSHNFCELFPLCKLNLHNIMLTNKFLKLTWGAFVWDQSGIRIIPIIGILRVSVCLGAILIPEYLDFHSSYSASRSRIAGINSGIYSYSGISQTNAPLDNTINRWKSLHLT